MQIELEEAIFKISRVSTTHKREFSQRFLHLYTEADTRFKVI
ncbi:hypothetical protein VIBNISO65_1190004 [Vibrio nigripulchritudo SO65]|nr:hypothetical protein VIBNIAM115_920002 [Vibrio nigripulchritudo AM115]CCN41755.1 hypothetical protein VIBNIFTn2_200004 [Vibrio nigripulchritudo FTn2]CCN63585.1 hypothetical protein VIBNIPon4_1310004 [Vibrio nigripulchritudo POn4]CCN74909.1 hypothetical protein VIBNISO65_1190004 [Vibrio nigripulchritudo SO65]